MTFARIRAPGLWVLGAVITPTEMEKFDQDQSQAVDGTGGGTYAPTNRIVIGGAGADFTGGTSTDPLGPLTATAAAGTGASGVVATGDGNGAGGIFTSGAGASTYGVSGIGNGNGATGVVGVGGPSSGAGGYFEGGSPNGKGITGQGAGAANGVDGFGGSTSGFGGFFQGGGTGAVAILG